MNILRFKRCPPDMEIEEIIAVLEDHRTGGNFFGPDGSFVICRCGERFPDGRLQDGNKLLRQHLALQIMKLQQSPRLSPNTPTSPHLPPYRPEKP